MRKKEIEFEGAKYIISPLNLQQVDDFVARPAATPAELKAQDRDLICSALNNAKPVGAQDWWTPESLAQEFDLPLLDFMREEILKFSGLARQPEGETKTSGEGSAASGNTSTRPAAAS